MKKTFFQLAKKSSAYLIAGLLSSFIGIFTLPLYTRFLTPNDYGITAIAISVTGFLTAFYQLGLMGAYTRFYFDYKNDLKELKKHISTITLFLAFYGLIFTFLIVNFKGVVEIFTKNVPFIPYILLAILSSYFSMFFHIKLNLYRIEQNAKKYLILFASSIILQTLITIYLVVFQKKGALGMIGAGLINNIIFAVISLWAIRNYLIPAIDFSKLKISLKYGLPLVPHIFAGWMLTLASRLILNNLVDTAEAGIFSVGYRVAAVMTFVSSSINFAWSPYFFKAMKDRGDSAKKEVTRFITYWISVMCFVFLLISILSKELLIIFTAPQYHGAYRVVPLIALGFLFQGFYFVFVNPLFWAKKTPIIATATITSGILSIGLNFLFIPKMQMIGAALAMALSFLYCFIFIAYFSSKSFPLPYEYHRIFKIVIAAALCCLIWIYFPSIENLWYSLFFKSLSIILCYPLLLIFMQFFKKEERRAIKDIFKTGRRYLYSIVFQKK